MENTLENKAKFFAQYFGQSVLMFNQLPLSSKHFISEDFEKYWIVLKPLSLISDEDAIEVAKLACVKLEEYHLETGKHVVNLIEEDAHLGSISCQEFLSIASYLKSKDYYIGDGAEIQYSWVKLENK